ncbi:arginase family protein [Spirillospora sp. CA-253888]
MADMTVVKVPQWQGARTERAELLPRGADLIARTLPNAQVTPVVVPREAGELCNGVHGLEVLAAVAEDVRVALADAGTGLTLTAGGDCGVELEPVAAAAARCGRELAVVWFDAHGDLNTPDSSPSGAFHGMVLRTLLGDGPSELVPPRPLDPQQVVLAGTRALDPEEGEYIERVGLRHVAVADLLAGPDRLVESVAGTGATAVYVHIDLDVLDPSAFRSLNCPEEDGLSVAALRDAVQALTGRFTLAGLGITEYAPADQADQDTLTALVPDLLPRRA